MAELKLPELGENITQGTVTKILVKSGDSIKKGQNILELETDKAVLEVPSNLEGVIKEILVQNGSVVKVGQPVFKLHETANASTQAQQPSATRGQVKQEQRNLSPSPLPSEKTIEVESTPGKPPSAKLATEVSEMKLPALGENIEKGTITKILVKAGDSLKKGQNILEIETDKAVLEVPSASEGLIKQILIKQGDVVKIGQPIFKIEGTTSTQAQPLPTRGHAAEAPPLGGDRSVSPSTLPSDAALNVKAPQGAYRSPNEPLPVRKDIPAAPSVRLLARELGIDIALVPGTGPAGRISAADVKAYCKMLNTTRPAGGGVTATAQPLPNFTKWGSVRREAMNNVRKKTAEHLSFANNSIPHVTQCDKVDITELEKLRKTIAGNKKISVTPFIIKVIAAALKKFPQFNSSIDMATQEIVFKDYVNVGIAVDTDRGLIVPVIKNVDKMSVLQINDELTAMAERARLRKTTIEEMQGGSFTISNLGGIGGTYFTPIVNWPEVAILGVSRSSMEPVYIEGKFEPRLVLPLSLSYDHRLIDGADGARFLRWVVEAIQQPSSLGINP